MRDKRRFCFSSVLYVMLATLAIHPFAFTLAQTESDFRSGLKKAEETYHEGLFDESVAILLKLAEQGGIKQKEKAEVYKLLVKVQLAQNKVQEARTSMKRMIELDPDIDLKAEEASPVIYVIYTEVKREYQKEYQMEHHKAESLKKAGWKFSKKWLLVGSGVVVTGLAALIYVTNRNKTSEDKFPAPPIRPGVNGRFMQAALLY